MWRQRPPLLERRLGAPRSPFPPRGFLVSKLDPCYSMSMKDLLDTIDWEELAAQKAWLFEEALLWNKYAEGLVNLLDHIQDAAEALGYPVVWLTENEE